jgi:hypothetical protein
MEALVLVIKANLLNKSKAKYIVMSGDQNARRSHYSSFERVEQIRMQDEITIVLLKGLNRSDCRTKSL